MLDYDYRWSDDKYNAALQSMPAPVLASRLPNVKIDLHGLVSYAHERGLKAGDLSDEEKNRFISGETVDSLQQMVRESVKYKSLVEWNSR